MVIVGARRRHEWQKKVEEERLALELSRLCRSSSASAVPCAGGADPKVASPTSSEKSNAHALPLSSITPPTTIDTANSLPPPLITVCFTSHTDVPASISQHSHECDTTSHRSRDALLVREKHRHHILPRRSSIATPAPSYPLLQHGRCSRPCDASATFTRRILRHTRPSATDHLRCERGFATPASSASSC